MSVGVSNGSPTIVGGGGSNCQMSYPSGAKGVLLTNTPSLQFYNSAGVLIMGTQDSGPISFNFQNTVNVAGNGWTIADGGGATFFTLTMNGHVVHNSSGQLQDNFGNIVFDPIAATFMVGGSTNSGTSGTKLKVASVVGGSLVGNPSAGTLVLNGTTAVVVANTLVTANSIILLTIQTPGGTPGAPYVSARVAGTSFSVKSLAADTSTCGYFIIEPV